MKTYIDCNDDMSFAIKCVLFNDHKDKMEMLQKLSLIRYGEKGIEGIIFNGKMFSKIVSKAFRMPYKEDSKKLSVFGIPCKVIESGCDLIIFDDFEKYNSWIENHKTAELTHKRLSENNLLRDN